MPNSKAKERRAFARFPVSLEIAYGFEIGRGTHQSGLGNSRDLSLGGIGMLQSEPIPLGQEISTTLFLSEEDHLILQGVVVWCRKDEGEKESYQTGVQWTESNLAAQTRLTSFLLDRRNSLKSRNGSVFPASAAKSAPIRWNVIAPIAFIAALLTLIGFLWLDHQQLTFERDSFKKIADSYNRQLADLISSSQHSAASSAASAATQ